MNIIKGLVMMLGTLLVLPGIALAFIVTVLFVILMFLSALICIPGALLVALVDGSFDT